MTGLDHLGDRRPAQPCHRGEVDSERRLPALGGEHRDGTVTGTGGGDRIVHEDGEAPKPFDGGGDERAACGFVAEIDGYEGRVAALAGDGGRHRLTAVTAAAGDDDASAFLREQASHRSPQTRGGPGDDGHLTCESTTGFGHDPGRNY